MRGQTKGVWVAHLPVALAYEAVEADPYNQRIPVRLASAIKELDRNGTFMVLDTEGDDELGQSAKAVRTLQLLTLDMSSHVVLTIGKQLGNEERANVLALTEQMRIITALNYPCDAGLVAQLEKTFGAKHILSGAMDGRGSAASSSHSWSWTPPALTIIPKDASGLLGEFLYDGTIEVNNLQRVVRVQSHATLDATSYFDEIKLPSGSGTLGAQLKSVFRDPKYHGGFPPTPQELSHIRSMDRIAGLPHMPPGALDMMYSFTHFTMPMIVSRTWAKERKGGSLSGRALVDLLQGTIDTFRSGTYRSEWLEHRNSETLSVALCRNVETTVEAWMNSTVMKDLEDSLPLENKPLCVKASGTLCRVGNLEEAFDRTRAQELLGDLCLLKLLMPTTLNTGQDAWAACFAESSVLKMVKDKYRSFLDRQMKACTYHVVSEDWGR